MPAESSLNILCEPLRYTKFYSMFAQPFLGVINNTDNVKQNTSRWLKNALYVFQIVF